MMLSWKIRYLDKFDKRFKDRCLELNTHSLDPAARAAVELVIESKSSRSEREILKFRHLFLERTLEDATVAAHAADSFNTFCVPDYFEDETGRQITLDEIGQVQTGSPTARLITSGARQHDIDLMLAEPKPVPLPEVSLSADDLAFLGLLRSRP